MNRFATALLLGCALITPAAAQSTNPQDYQWYIGHIDAEVCVPLDDVGSHGQRVYYGAGNMHTPYDFSQFLIHAGIKVTSKSYQFAIVFTGILSDGATMIVTLWNDLGQCHVEMSHERT